MFKIVNLLWGKVSNEELKKFGVLSLVLFFIVGTYWIVRPVKDALFLTLVGKAFLPYAKIISLVTLVFFLMMYSKLVDILEKHHLVYFFNLLTSLFFFLLAIIILMHPTIYTQISFISQIIGWTAFVGSECLLALQFSLFWSFVTSSFNTQEAKKGYPIIIAGAQIGGIVGPLLTINVMSIGIAYLLFISGFFICLNIVIIKLFTVMHPHIFDKSDYQNRRTTGAMEGLRLLITHPYLMGILLISILPDVIGEMLNISMLFLVKNNFHSPESVVAFLGFYGILVNTASFVFAFFGASYFLRTWGLTIGLVFNPIITAMVIIFTWMFYSLWSVVIALIFLKGLDHALAQTSREIMFIPTSRDIIFKTKSWITILGSRVARGAGAGFVAFFVSMGNLIAYGSLVSLGLISLWIPVALYIGKTNNKLVVEHKILE